MRLLKLTLRVLMMVPVSMLAGLFVYMEILLIGMKFESHEYPVIAMVIGGPVALVSAVIFFVWSVTRLYEKHAKMRIPADQS